MNKKRKKRIVRRSIEVIDILIIIGIVALIVWSIINRAYLQNLVSKEVQRNGLIAMFIIILFLELIPQLINPIFVSIPLMFLINPYLVLLVAIISSTVGSILGYFIGKKFGFKLLPYFMKEKNIEKTSNFINKAGRFILVLAAISPLPYVPMIWGILDMRGKNFILFGLLPRAIGLFLMNYLVYIGIV